MTAPLLGWRIMPGDCRASLATLEPGSVQTVVTSPPYFGLRDYGTADWDGGDPDCDHKQGRPGAGRADGVVDARAQRNRDGVGSMGGDCRRCGATRVDQQIGLEPTPDEFVIALVEVFRAVRRVLRDDGTVWLNLGDSYAGNSERGRHDGYNPTRANGSTGHDFGARQYRRSPDGFKPKDLIGIPWAAAFALRADGWYLRSDIIWAKPNPMPESVTDRPTKAHEYLFLLSKGPRYFYDADAIREQLDTWAEVDGEMVNTAGGQGNRRFGDEVGRPGVERLTGNMAEGRTISVNPAGRNKRSVWTVATQPYSGAHFATFPLKLIEPCILAGTSPTACGQCGAPWQRVVERGESAYARLKREEGMTWQQMEAQGAAEGKNLKGGGAASVGGTRKPNGVMAQLDAAPSRLLGWEPTCDHQDDTGSSVVLDPFSGAGTTGIVALRHNRSYIGCELNPEYVEMSRRRIVDDAPLLNSFSEAAA